MQVLLFRSDAGNLSSGVVDGRSTDVTEEARSHSRSSLGLQLQGACEGGSGRNGRWKEGRPDSPALRHSREAGQEQEVHEQTGKGLRTGDSCSNCHRRGSLLLSMGPRFQTRSLAQLFVDVMLLLIIY